VQPGVPTGDVVFLLQAIPHESFERSGNDLLTHITITLSEALLGFSRVIITHLDGRGVKLSTPPGKVIKPQDSIVLRGEGMPLYRRPDEKGDLYVLIDIEMPDQDWLSSIDRNVSLSAVILTRVQSEVGWIYL
jgi:DnaJ family protein A protein 2